MILQPLAIVITLSTTPAPVDICALVEDVLAGGPAAHDASVELIRLGGRALPRIREALDGHPDRQDVTFLMAILSARRDPRADAAIRPFVFSADAVVAAVATRAHYLANGPRSAPLLEHLLVENRSFDQSLAALEGLSDMRLPSTFDTLATYAQNASYNPVLRVVAAGILPEIHLKDTKKWLKKLPLPATKNAFFREEVFKLYATHWPGKTLKLRK